MTINLQDLLTAVGGVTGISFAITFLMKSVINHALDRDAEKFKARLKADADVEIEQLKHNLQKVALEHQVRFSKLHERRAEVIAELYSHLVDAERCTDRFVTVEAYLEETKRQEAHEATRVRLVDLYYFVEKNRIYLPEHVCELLTTFVSTIRKSVIGANIYAPIEPQVSPYLLQEKIRILTEIYEAFQGSIPQARIALEKEFRAILGVE